MDQLAICVRNIYKTYKPSKEVQIRALRDLSLEVARGELLAINGVSGSGKSTLLHIIGGLDKADSGEVTVDGKLVSSFSGRRLARYRNSTIGFVLQDFGLIPYRTVYENICVPLYISDEKGISMRKVIDAQQEALGIPELRNRKVNGLSGGQRQRVAIARALVHNPSVILADEPTGALDSETKGDVMKLLSGMREQGRTVVIVTHDPGISLYADRTISIADGHIAEGGR